MYTLIYFSPTGNTKFLAKQLKSELSIEDDRFFSMESAPKLKSTESLILMYPIHGFNPPRTVQRFVKKLSTCIFRDIHLIAVGCNTSWVNNAVSVDIKRSLIKKKYKVLTDEVLAMPLTLVTTFPMDLSNNIIKESQDKIKSIANSIKSKEYTEKNIPFKSKLIHTIGKLEDPAARLFGLELHAKKSCTSCGICWNRCPEDNIKEKNGKPKFGFKCELCMRCINECPENSITPYISKFMTQKEQYNIKNYIDK